MVARAASSWKVNDLATWSHAWDNGDDGNPLHRGLRTEQKLCIGGVNYALRYWRSLIRPNEIRVNVEVTYSDTGKYAVHTQRFFTRTDVHRKYAIAAVPALLDAEKDFQSGIRSICARIREAATFTYGGRGVRLVVLPHESNMPKGWQDFDETRRWESAEPFPTAGRSSGPFVSALREAARDADLWVCCGVVLRRASGLLRGVVLIGADGWLHAVCTDSTPVEGGPFVAGAGDWPATQQSRPRGVYDTELGRIALCAHDTADVDLAAKDVAAMGAELVLVPPPAGSTHTSRVVAELAAEKSVAPHSSLTVYDYCGPEPITLSDNAKIWKPVVVIGKADALEVPDVKIPRQ
eukprot:TRINITY_DN1284_c0_g2_i1.p1 TRINITY_DN1284_c0_g2~~TRINITY_DN1284_c0_g2_i1.p1  ORF type:complete len:392 (-),score=86.47 TRINITY_DN1284_c0_g2_i1:83-1132(-)